MTSPSLLLLLSLLSLSPSSLAWPDGPPTCDPAGFKPNHDGSKESEYEKLSLVSTVEPSRNSDREYFITFMRHERPFKGILIRPSEGSVQGTFSGFDEDKYKVLEVDGHCLTHKVSKAVDSNVAQVVVFTADEAGRSPAFDVIMVEEKHKWWRTTFE